MSSEIQLLSITAAGIGLFHTLAGPDHYLPFIFMARARNWSRSKTSLITFLCGLGHVLSSLLIGLVGIGLGLALVKLELVESFRGDIASWGLTAFGFTYMVWGIWRAIKNRPHNHIHDHADGLLHQHEHRHRNQHCHIHGSSKVSITPWILFTIFIFGPCEPLIPILMYPAAKDSLYGMMIVSMVFGIVTIGTMLLVVVVSNFGIAKVSFGRFERYTDAVAGGMICICGLAVLFLLSP